MESGEEVTETINRYVDSMLSKDAPNPLPPKDFFQIDRKGNIPALLDIFYFFLEKREEIYENNPMSYTLIVGDPNFSAFEGMTINVKNYYEEIIKISQNLWLDYKVAKNESRDRLTLGQFLKNMNPDLSLLFGTVFRLLEKDYRENLNYYLSNSKYYPQLLAAKIIEGKRDELGIITPGYLREVAGPPPGVTNEEYIVEIYLLIIDILTNIFKSYAMTLEEIFPRAFSLISVDFRETISVFYAKLKRISLELSSRQKHLLNFPKDLLGKYYPEIVSEYNKSLFMKIAEKIIEENVLKQNPDEMRYQQIKNKSGGEIPNPYIKVKGEKKYFLKEKGRERVDIHRVGVCKSSPFMISERDAENIYVGEEKVPPEELYPAKICPTRTLKLSDTNKTYFLTETNDLGEKLSEYCKREGCPLFYDPLTLSEKYINREAKRKLKEIQLIPPYFIAEDQEHLTIEQLNLILSEYTKILERYFSFYVIGTLELNLQHKYSNFILVKKIYRNFINLDNNSEIIIDEKIYTNIEREIVDDKSVYFFQITFEKLKKGSNLPGHVALLVVDSHFKKISLFFPESVSQQISSFFYYKFVNNLAKTLSGYQLVEPGFCPSIGLQNVGNNLDIYCNIWIFFYMENYLNFRNYALEKNIRPEDYDYHQEVFASLILEKSKEAGFVIKSVISYLYYLVENTRRYLISIKEKDEFAKRLLNQIEESFVFLPYYKDYINILQVAGLIYDQV